MEQQARALSMAAAIGKMNPYYGNYRTPIKLYDVATGENIIGSLPAHLGEEPWLMDGLECVMFEVGLMIGWRRGAPSSDKPVEVLDLIWDRFAQIADERNKKANGSGRPG